MNDISKAQVEANKVIYLARNFNVNSSDNRESS
jgi:hypothetical protein